MRLPDVNEFVKRWPKSLSILKEAVLTYFQNNNIPTNNIWFVDIDMVIPKNICEQPNVQIVLFGGFVERVFETGNWPDNKYTVWCLSLSVKNVLTKLLNFPENSIRVIPRYELFAKAFHEKFFDLKSDLQIVYSGRLSSQKNIEMVLAFASILQEKIQAKVKVSIFGEWDNHIPRDRGLFKIDSFKDSVEKFQNELSFKIAPEFITTLGHDEWIEKIEKNSLLVNFSTFFCEDFGVSIAQAQKAGIPMLLSKWGGHRDVVAGNIQFINTSDVGQSLTSKEQIMLKAEKVVNDFIASRLVDPEYENDNFSGPLVYLTLVDFQSIRSSAMKKYGNEMAMIGKDLLVPYSSSQNGKLFFKDYSKVFSGAEL